MSGDPEVVPGVPVGEMALAWALLVAACAAGALATGEFTRVSLRAGAPLLLAGGLLALASVRALGRGRELVTRGPYRWVRHPYFLGDPRHAGRRDRRDALAARADPVLPGRARHPGARAPRGAQPRPALW